MGKGETFESILYGGNAEGRRFLLLESEREREDGNGWGIIVAASWTWGG